jgi:hypothetical protein
MERAMPMNTTRRPKCDEAFQAELERVAETLRGIVPAFSQALTGLVDAFNYGDKAVVQSHMQAALAALKDFMEDKITVLQRHSLSALWATIKENLKGEACEDYDGLGKWLETRLKDRIEILQSFRDTAEMLKVRDYEVEGAAHLDQELDELQELKSALGRWPWSSRQLPPVDRKMVAESRASIARGEGEPIEQLIRRLGEAVR